MEWLTSTAPHVRWWKGEVMEGQMNEVDDGVLGKAKQLSYLKDIFDSEGDVERAVRGTEAVAWNNW